LYTAIFEHFFLIKAKIDSPARIDYFVNLVIVELTVVFVESVELLYMLDSGWGVIGQPPVAIIIKHGVLQLPGEFFDRLRDYERPPKEYAALLMETDQGA
jgi:hypothetical protein